VWAYWYFFSFAIYEHVYIFYIVLHRPRNFNYTNLFCTIWCFSHVRYRGYCPQIKYRVGKTYGTDTHQLSEKTDHVHPLPPVGPSKPVLSNKLPAATGDNKYTEQMVPGYTGNYSSTCNGFIICFILSLYLYICLCLCVGVYKCVYNISMYVYT